MKETLHKELDRKILLNPGPATTSSRVKKGLLVSDICPREKEFGDLLGTVSEKLLKVVHANSGYETILLGGSGTAAIESCLSSCVDKSDSILIVANGAYGRRMEQICRRLDIGHEVVRFEAEESIDWQKVDKLLGETTKKFRIIATVHHETTTGILNSLVELMKVAKKFKLATLVDAMSSYAGIEIDLPNLDIDYLVSSSNKCIQGMAGLGIVIAKSSELEKIKRFHKRSFYLDLYENYLSQKEKNQFLFTPPVQILYALNEALDEFFAEGGIEKRAARYESLYQTMVEGMTKIGFNSIIDSNVHSKILTTFAYPTDKKFSFEKMHDHLFERGITVYPGKIEEAQTFRIANIGDLNEADIQYFLKVISGYLESSKIEM